MAKRTNTSEDRTDRYYNGTSWTSEQANALFKLTRLKQWTYHDYSENFLYEPGGQGGWQEVPRGSGRYKQLTGVERGHVYIATPLEEKGTGAPLWQITSPVRIGDESLAGFGLPRGVVYKTDFEVAEPITDEVFCTFQQNVLRIGGTVTLNLVDMNALQERVEQATALVGHLDVLLAQATTFRGQIDASAITQLEEWHKRALHIDREYLQERRQVQTLVGRLKSEPKRSSEKAQAGAWLLLLKDHPAVGAINGLLKEAVAERELQLAGGQAKTNPLVAYTFEVLSWLYRSSPTVTVTFDGEETITLKRGGGYGGSVRLTSTDVH